MKKKILITGHLGLTGRACTDLFAAKGWEVIGVDNNARAGYFGTETQEAPENSINYFVDIKEQSLMEDIFKDNKFDAIIHTAAQPSHDWSTDNVLYDFDTNARATVILFELARQYCPHAAIVFVSTDKVYGENMNIEGYVRNKWKEKGYPSDKAPEPAVTETRYHCDFPFDETLGLDFAGDRSFFGCSKAAADMYAQQYAARFHMNIGIFRPGCITGKNHQGAEQHGFLAYLAKCIKEGITYNIYGNGKQVRDQIHAEDLASAFESFIKNPRAGTVYNIGGGLARSVSVLEAGRLIEQKLKLPFVYEYKEERRGDRRWDVHDVSKFRKDYPDFEYRYSLQDIIKDICS